MTNRNTSKMLSTNTNEQVEIAAALATSRKAAQMTSTFRDIENNVAANLSQQQRGLLSEITSESAQALKAQRHNLFQEATEEMMQRDTRDQEACSQLRSELQHYHRHAVGQADECQQFQAELRQHLQRSNGEGEQLRNLYEETGNANASVATELVTEVSTM